MKTTTLLLFTTVAIQAVMAVPIAHAASDNGSIVVAQADDRVAAARRALEQAQASLKQAEDTGGDVRGARKSVAAAMMDLRTAEAAGGGSSSPSPAKPPVAAQPPRPAAGNPPPAPAGNSNPTGQPKPYTPPAPAEPEPKAKEPAKTPPVKTPPVKTAPPKTEPKVEPKAEPKVEPRVAPRTDSKPDVKADQRVRPLPEQPPAPARPLPPAPPVVKRPPPPVQPYDQQPPRRGEREVPPPDYGDDDGPPRRRDYGDDRALPPASIPEGRGETTTTEIRPNGVRILTITDRDGRVLRRIRVDRYGNRTTLSEFDRRMGRPDYDDQPPEQAPPRFRPGRDGYVLDGDNASEAEIEGTLRSAPILRPQRGYSIDEIKRNSDLRDMVRRIDIDTITFDFGSDAVPEDQIGKLRTIGRAIGRILDRNPREVFLIEGHTDAVGTDLANLELSDRRANSVSDILSEYFDIPPENLVSQGYGERYLKVPTDEPERLNRRVTIRRITPLLRGGD